MPPLVPDPGNIRLAMVGMVEGNGHPYSWSAVFNGYDPESMAQCPYPVIPEYLSKQPVSAFGIPGAQVTHIWCENPEEARKVAAASLIPHIVEEPLEVIGKVDAVIIPTDIGSEHLQRATPFMEAGLPVFIDKPLTDREGDLREFARLYRQGKPFLSASCMRYAREYSELRKGTDRIGQLRVVTMTTPKSWERYGIHALEGVYPFLTPGGCIDVTNSGSDVANIVHIRHRDGVDILIAAVKDLYGAFGCLELYGTDSTAGAKFSDTFYAFKRQMEVFVEYLKTGIPPFPFAETVELMKLVIAGIRSREEKGRRVRLSEIEVDVSL